jgi:hypothetical protein
MTITIFVEGDTEVLALPRLLRTCLGPHPLRPPIPLYGAQFLPRIGKAAAAILMVRAEAHVFACPDLAPRDAFTGRWRYQDYEDLQEVLRREVRGALSARLRAKAVDAAMKRFHPHPFRHDFEVVLLACPDALKRRLGTRADVAKQYHRRPEEQNFEEYPKRVVRRLFRKFAKRRYHPTDDCPRILEYASPEAVKGIERACPRFGEFVAALRSLAGGSGAGSC